MFTSYFANVKKLPPGLVPVSIARGSPRWFTGKKELRLAPGRAMLKMQKSEFDARFAEILAQLDPAELYAALGENAVLLCYEKPGVWCHRRLVAEWLETALGIEIPEYGFERVACVKYAEMGAAAPEVRQPVHVNLHALGVRWRAGEKIGVLAREAGMSWNKLWSELTKLGYRDSDGDGRRD